MTIAVVCIPRDC